MTSEIGKITKWSDEKGFGFITPNSGGKSVFIHINDFSKRHKRPIEGLSVTYDLAKDKRGRACAVNVSPKRGHKEVTQAGRQKVSALILSGAFMCLVIGLVFLHRLPPVILGVYIVVSALPGAYPTCIDVDEI